jgi:hypothetical protein
MATDAKADMTDAELLHFYLGLRLQKGDGKVPIKQILTDFPAYLRERNAMREMIRDAEAAIASGRSGVLDVEQAINEVIQELAAEGITE